MIKRLLAVVGLSAMLALGACAALNTAATTTVTTQQLATAKATAYGLESSYDLALAVAIAWAKQPTCGTAKAPAPPLCRTLAGMEKIEAVRLRVRSSIDRLNAVIADTSTSTSVLTLTINAAQQALREYQSALPAVTSN